MNDEEREKEYLLNKRHPIGARHLYPEEPCESKKNVCPNCSTILTNHDCLFCGYNKLSLINSIWGLSCNSVNGTDKFQRGKTHENTDNECPDCSTILIERKCPFCGYNKHKRFKTANTS